VFTSDLSVSEYALLGEAGFERGAECVKRRGNLTRQHPPAHRRRDQLAPEGPGIDVPADRDLTGVTVRDDRPCPGGVRGVAVVGVGFVGEPEALAVEFLDPGAASPGRHAAGVHDHHPLRAYTGGFRALGHTFDRIVPRGKPVEVGNEVERRGDGRGHADSGASFEVIHGCHGEAASSECA
jgi:hypothetical protein